MLLKRKSKNIKFIYMSGSGVGSSRDEYLTVRGFRLY